MSRESFKYKFYINILLINYLKLFSIIFKTIYIFKHFIKKYKLISNFICILLNKYCVTYTQTKK